MEDIKVSANSTPKAVAGAIAARLQENSAIDIQVIGAKALNQAMKAIIVARTYMQKNNCDIYITPTFSSVNCDDKSIVAIRLSIARRNS